MNGTPQFDVLDLFLGGSGMGIGMLGFCMADVGAGGRSKSSLVSPGTKRTTTLGTREVFLNSQVMLIKCLLAIHLDTKPVGRGSIGDNVNGEVANFLSWSQRGNF